MSFMPSCREVREQLTEYQEGAMPWHARLGMALHLCLCRACDGFRKNLLRLPRLSKQLLDVQPGTPGEAQQALAEVLKTLKLPHRHS